VKEAPKSRTIGAKIYKKVIMKETQNKREIIFKNYSKKKPKIKREIKQNYTMKL